METLDIQQVVLLKQQVQATDWPVSSAPGHLTDNQQRSMR
jgi:hypothetical protein